MKRIIKFYPAFDKRNTDSSKNYGIHCMDIFFVLIGELGAVSFTIFSGWFLPHIDSKTPKGSGACISYHTLNPVYDGQNVSKDECEWLEGKACYCDSTYIQAEELFNILVAEGDEAMWCELENKYDEVIKNKIYDKD